MSVSMEGSHIEPLSKTNGTPPKIVSRGSDGQLSDINSETKEDRIASDQNELPPASHTLKQRGSVSETKLDELKGPNESETPSDRSLQRVSTTKPVGANRKAHPKKAGHARSQSQTKVHTRLSTSASGHKPVLPRSKSTDGVMPKTRPAVNRNNRSYTKLTALQPLKKSVSTGTSNRPLGPLLAPTKTMSRESLKQNALRKTASNSMTISTYTGLPKTGSNQSLRSNRSSGSLKSFNNKSNTSLKALTNIGSITASVGLKTSSKRGKAILRLNEDDEYNEYEDMSDDSCHEEERERVEGEIESKVMGDYNNESTNGEQNPPFVNPESRSTSNQSIQSTMSTHAYGRDGTFDETNVNNLYGGSFLLSQSTGMTRKIDPSKQMLGGYPVKNVDVDDSIETGDLQKSMGIEFKTRSEDDARVTEPESNPKPSVPAAASASVTQGSYQPDQTIFNNLKRNDSDYTSNIKQQRQHGNMQPISPPMDSDAHKDFSSYLNNQQGSNGQNIETRTQQRLWLQRENSLLDVSAGMDLSSVGNFSNISLNKLMFAHNYNNGSAREVTSSASSQLKTPESNLSTSEGNGLTLSEPHVSAASMSSTNMSAVNMLYLLQNGQQNSIQSRMEFERLNREYVNVRRHLNPVAESLNRLEKHGVGKVVDVKKKQDKKIAYGANTNANSFKEFAPSWEKREGETAMLLNKMWQDALISGSSLSLSARLFQQEQQRHLSQRHPRHGEYVNQMSVKDLSGTNQMKQHRRSLANSISQSPVPATRAIKLANGQTASDYTAKM